MKRVTYTIPESKCYYVHIQNMLLGSDDSVRMGDKNEIQPGEAEGRFHTLWGDTEKNNW